MGQNGDNSLMDGEKEKDLLKYKFKEQLDSGRNRIQTQKWKQKRAIFQ